MNRADEAAIGRLNEDFDPPFPTPPPTICAQLWAAARQGHNEFDRVMQELEDAGWEMTRLQCSSNEHGQNFLHAAAETGDWRVLLVLTHFFTTRHAPLPIYVTVPRKRLPVQPDKDGNTPLHIASRHDNLDFAKALMKYYIQFPIMDPLDADHPHDNVSGASTTRPMSTYEMQYAPGLRYLLDLKNVAGLTASQAAYAAGATTTAEWLDGFRKQGADGIELVAGEESGDELLY